MRQRRRSLGARAALLRDQQLCRHLLALPLLQHCRHIAGYWPNDGEIGPLPALRHWHQQGKTVYLPQLLANKQLRFACWHGDVRGLRANRFGIPEPVQRRHVSGCQLDAVLMPLVAFDRNGNRLGMGGGYYDRSFAFRLVGWRNRPLLIGLAHDFQQQPALPCESWDIPLDMIVTNRGVLPVGKRRRH